MITDRGCSVIIFLLYKTAGTRLDIGRQMQECLLSVSGAEPGRRMANSAPPSLATMVITQGEFMSRVLIADDYAVCRAGYRQFLVAEPTITEVGEAASGNETLDLLRQQEWDLLLMDIHMPDRTGLDASITWSTAIRTFGIDHERPTRGAIRPHRFT